MCPIPLISVLALLLLPVSAFADFVDRYGNPVIPAESYRQMPGGAAWRDTHGQTHEYVKPSDPTPMPSPASFMIASRLSGKAADHFPA